MVAVAGSARGRAPALAKYEVLEELGHGGMATVYRAHDKRLARDVAIKVLHPHLRESSEIAHRFGIEAKAVAKLRHPNIVEVFDVSADDDEEKFLVVELIRGETLRKLLQKRGAIPPEAAAALSLEILGALVHAHGAGVVHRDVKPENVLVEHRELGPESTTTRSTGESRGDRIFVKLTDFGIAKLLDAQGVTSTGQVLGSPAHMAPEQIEGAEVDGRADVFGLGVLLYECMVGHLPFEGNNPAQVLRRVLDGSYPSAEREKATIGRGWSQILDRALAHDPADRYPDANAFRDALTNELARVGIVTPRSELEAFFDAPETWSEAHEKRLVGKLCDLGRAARAVGDALSAAADYNRALAYSPSDPNLLRIVTNMHRDEARRRFVRKAAPLLLGSIALGVGTFFVTRALKAPPSSLLAPGQLALGKPTPSSVPPEPSSAPSLDAAVEHVLATPQVRPSGGVPAKTVKRVFTLATLRPPFGVHLLVDGVPAGDKEQGGIVLLDEKAHSLTFACNGDMCEPRTLAIAAGEKDDTLTVELRILPARLVVDGEPSHSYGIVEQPTITVTSGVAADIPLGRGSETWTVFDRAEPSKRVVVRLKAGAQSTVALKNP